MWRGLYEFLDPLALCSRSNTRLNIIGGYQTSTRENPVLGGNFVDISEFWKGFSIYVCGLHCYLQSNKSEGSGKYFPVTAVQNFDAEVIHHARFAPHSVFCNSWKGRMRDEHVPVDVILLSLLLKKFGIMFKLHHNTLGKSVSNGVCMTCKRPYCGSPRPSPYRQKRLKMGFIWGLLGSWRLWGTLYGRNGNCPSTFIR